MGTIKRLPKHPQVFIGEILGSGMNEIQLFAVSVMSVYGPGFQLFICTSVATFRAIEKSKIRLNEGGSLTSRRFKTCSTALFCISALRVPSWVIAGSTT